MAEWYEEFFEGDWLRVQRHFHSAEDSDAQAASLVSLLELEPGDTVLDVPCGAGRISVPLAARGLGVTGVDRTAALLDDARAAAAAADVPLDLEERDMRDLPWTDRFDAAVNLWGSFGYFDDAGNLAFAEAVCRALVPGGRFVIDTPSWETIFPTFQPRGWRRVDDVRMLEDRTYDPLTGQMKVNFTLLRGGEETVLDLTLRLYTCYELVALLRQAGFSSFAPYGGLDGSDFGIGERLVLVARK